MEEAGEGHQVLADNSSANKVPKRWGFRRSTIAKREFMEEVGNLEISSVSAPRRGARQARGRGRGRGRGKGKEADDARPDSPAPKRGRGGKKSAPANLSSVPSPAAPDTPTTTDFAGSNFVCLGTTQQKANSAANPRPSIELQAASDIKAFSEAAVSDQTEDSDDLTLRELQERARNRRRLEEASALLVTDLNLNTNSVNKGVGGAHEQKQCLQSEQNNDVRVQGGASSSSSNQKADTSLDASKKDQKLLRVVGINEVEEEAMQSDSDRPLNDSSEESDPNAIYCICRQTHSNRFMICCDRCQEWFHGDCVGITEARGRLLEKNGEDYICPTCSPCQSPVEFLKQPVLSRAALSSSSESLLSSSAGEDRPSEDEGIRGKIRKATTHSTKRKFKIFHPVKVGAAVLEREKENEEKVNQKVTEEKAAAPKCIGPGCFNDALPESVYCGHQCIIRHAAVAMQTITEPKPQTQIQAKPAPKPVPKIQKKTFLEKLFKRKVVEKPVKEEEGSCKEAVVSSRMEESVAAPLSTDSEPKATGAQESTAIAPSVFYKSTTVKDVKENVKNEAKTKEDAPQSKPPSPPASSETPEKEEKTEKADDKVASPGPLPRKPVCNPLPSRAKKTMPGSPRLAGLRHLQSELSQGKKNTITVSEEPTQNNKPTTAPQAQTLSSGPAPEIRVLPVTPAPVAPSRPLQAHPNMQMRQNIRRSLTEALSKRVSESDDLEMSESDVGRLAVNIEREMFNMYYTTDNKYKNKYRTLLLSLKDPRNKGLFYQVMKGYITPFKLTRLSQQELQGVENIAATPLKEDPPPVCVNMEEPLSVCEEKVVKSESTASSLEEKASASQSRPTQPRKVSTAVSDIISSMLKDTTSEHKAHLFDLKCRICTGQISADEDPDAKTLKKEELKEIEEEKPQFVIQMFDKRTPADVPEEADPVMESPASPTAEDSSMGTTSSEFSPMVIPEVSVVSITRRDPRTAAYRPAPPPSVAPPPAQASSMLQTSPQAQTPPLTRVPPPAKAPPSAQALVPPQALPFSLIPPPVQASPPAQAPVQPQRLPLMPVEEEKVEKPKTVQPLPLLPPPPMPKSILLKPSAPSLPSFYTASGSTTRLAGSHAPSENETGQFLSKQDTVWKGFLNMLNVAKFVTKAYLISGTASAEVLKKDLPDTIHIGGRILPQTVWEYVEKVKTSVTKELSLIRFHPATDEEEVAYVSLFSYFNSRQRFGVVSNICNSIKDLYLIPLSAKESIPSLLLPLEGPGLEEQHPNLILGLAICQKLKRPGAPSQEFDEKRPRLLVPLDSQGVSLPTVPDVKLLDGSEPYDPDIPISTTPPESPPGGGSPDLLSSFSSSLTGPSALSDILSVVSLPTKTAVASLIPPSDADTSSSNTPLQTILNTLFGNKKQDSDLTVNTSGPSPSEVKEPSVSSPTSIDPIVRQFQQTPKDTSVEKMELELDDDDRPYDPEEEYDPAVEYQNVAILNLNEISKPNTSATNEVENVGGGDDDDDRPYDPEEEYNLGSKVDTQLATSINVTKFSEIQPPVDAPEIKNDIAYDPEDETVFEEMQTYLADANTSSTSQYGTAPSVTLSEQQRLLEELNRQIEEQKRQLEEQEEALRLQRVAVGVSMAHFSVSDALMSPPPCFGREPEEPTVKAPAFPTMNTSRDPRQSRNARQDSVADNIIINNNKVNSINDNFMRKQALTQATFLEPSNNPLVQNMCLPEQELKLDVEKKDTDIPSVTLADKRSTSIDRKDHHSVTNLRTSTLQSASELDESTQSSSNEKNKHSDSRRQRHSSKPDNHSSPRNRSRQNDHRSHHKEKSRASRDEADRYRRRGRRSPGQSRRSRSRSRDRSCRQERVSLSQRDRHHHRSTSRHRTRRDHCSPRLRSTQRRRSEQPEDDKSHQKEQSPSRPRRESADHSNELSQSTKQEASRSAEIQGDELPNKASENGEQNVSEVHQKTENDQPSHRRQPSTDLPGLQDTFSQREQLPLMTNLYQGDFSQPGSKQFYHESKLALEALSAQREHSIKDLKVRNENRDEPEVQRDNFAQRDHSELPPQRNRNTCSSRQADLLPPGPQSFHSESASRHGPRQSSENKPHTSRENSLQRDDFLQDESKRFHHRGQPRYDRSLPHQSQADQFPNIRDPRGNVPHNEPTFSGHKDEQKSFGSLQSQRSHSLYHEADTRRQLLQRIPQTHGEGSSEHEQPFSRNKHLPGPPDLQRKQLPQPIPQTHREGSLEHEQSYFRNQKPLSGPPDRASGNFSNDPDLHFNREALGICPSQGHRSNLPPDEAHPISHDNYTKRMPPRYGEERVFSPSGTDEVHNAERYSGNFPSQETGSGYQRGLPYRAAHLPEKDFVQPEAEETDFKNNPHQMPSRRRRGSFHKDEAEQVHHHDHASADFLQERDIPREIYLREQFRPRAPGDQWRGPSPRVHGPRGPPLGALMTPRGPTAMRPRMPRAPHPERFENSAPCPDFGPRGPYPRPRMIVDAGTSPNLGPRGPPLRPVMCEGTEPSTNKNVRPRGPSPVSHMSLENSPQDPVFKSRFQGSGVSEGHIPHMFRPRGPSSGPRMFEGPRPGPLRFRHVMGGPRGPRCLFQPRHEVPRGLLDVGGPLHQQFDNGDSDLPHLNDSRGFHGTSDCDPDQPFDEAQLQCSDESNSQNSANESFTNPQEERRLLCRWIRGQPSIPMSRNPSCNLPEIPLFPDMDSGVRGTHQFDEFGDQGTQEEMDGPHFEKLDFYEGSMDHEDDTQTKGPHFNQPRDFSCQRTPSPLFPGLRMPAPRNKELFEDVKMYSPCFPRKIAPTSTQSQRLPGPKRNEISNLMPHTKPQMVRPQMVQARLVGPPKEPDVRPLRLSGPLLPTPPGGPIRMQNPRMQRPQGPLARGPNTGMNPPSFDDKIHHPQRESSHSLIHKGPAEEHGNEGEESSSQDSSPVKRGKRWRRRPRKREGRNKAARKQRIKECRKSGGEEN